MVKLSHDALEKFVSDVLNKREPCPAMVLAWGWMLKQGEGGVFHNDTFKQRYFVLARVPHATVLIYYGEKCMDEDHILGFIDLRRVTSVRETTKLVALDTNKSAATSIMTRLKGLVGQGPPPEGTPRPVLELVTSSRVFVLAPATIVMPPPMTTAMALGPSATGKPLYLFGWPFPVPPLDGEDDEAEVHTATVEGRFSTDAFAQWRDVMATAVTAEKATRVFPVMTLVDSSAQLPGRVLLRTTPCELAIISVDDKDLAFAAVPYNDLLKWEVQVETELHLTARTRSRLVARPDRTGFTSQRPTRPTCHFVFKSTAARAIVSVIDAHLRALAKQLGADVDGGAGGDDDDDGVDAVPYDDSADGGMPADDDDMGGEGASAGKSLVGRKPAAQPASRRGGDDEEDDGEGDEDDGGGSRRGTGSSRSAASSARPVSGTSASSKSSVTTSAKKSPASAKAAAPSSRRRAAESEEDEEEEESPPPKAKAKAAVPAVKSKASKKVESDDEEEEAPKPKASKKTVAKVADSEDEDADDDVRPVVKSKKSTSKKAVEDSDSEEKPPAKARSSKKAAVVENSEEEEEEEMPKPKAKAKAKAKVASDSE